MSPGGIAHIGLGSNLENPVEQIESAFDELETLTSISSIVRSGIYSSPPMGPADQPDYCNAVAAIETSMEPYPLLHALQEIELLHHRRRLQRWGPRTLDLDLLLYGDQVMDDAALTIPHPGIAQRAFVLYPLQQIAPGLELPGMGDLSSLIALCPQGEVTLVAGW